MFKKTSLIFFIITLLTGCAKNVSSPIHIQDEKHKHSTPSIKKIILPIPTAKVDSSQIIFSPDYKKVAAIIHPLNTNKIPRIMIWNPVNGSLLHSTALSKNEAKAHNFGSMRFSSNSQTLVYTQRGNDWSFIWNFTKQKKPIFCQMGSEILDINTQLVLVKPTDGVIGLYDLNNCKVIALAFNNILGSKDVVIGADNKMLWITTQYLPKKLKDAWLYHKLPAFRMYHSKIFKNKTDLVELPTVLRHKNTSGSMAPDRIFFNTSKKELILYETAPKKNKIALTLWDYANKKKKWAYTFQVNDFLFNKEPYDIPRKGIFHSIDFNAEKFYLLGKNTIQIINIKTGKSIKTIAYPKESLAKKWARYSHFEFPFFISSNASEIILKSDNETEVLSLVNGRTIDKFNTHQLSKLVPLSGIKKTKKPSYDPCPSNQWKCLFSVRNNISPNGKYIAFGKDQASNVIIEVKSKQVIFAQPSYTRSKFFSDTNGNTRFVTSASDNELILWKISH